MEKEELLEGYRKMLLIRRLETELVKYYYDNRIMSFVHFSLGMEASAVSVVHNLGESDKFLGGHRSHSLYLSSGADPGKMVAEMLGKKAGCSKGVGGSMHLCALSHNFLGSTPILGPVVSIAAGVALSKKIRQEDGVVVAFIGDGASEQSEFYSTLNFASLHNLPLLVVIENNLFSVNTPLSSRRSPRRSTQGIVESFGLNYIWADGNDFLEANEAAKKAIQLTREGIPTVLEMEVYRSMAHSAPITDEKYRVVDTKEEREKKDSVKNLKIHLEEKGYDLAEIEKEVEIEVAAAMEFGINAI